jgi:hypothetical protein
MGIFTLNPDLASDVLLLAVGRMSEVKMHAAFIEIGVFVRQKVYRSMKT